MYFLTSSYTFFKYFVALPLDYVAFHKLHTTFCKNFGSFILAELVQLNQVCGRPFSVQSTHLCWIQDWSLWWPLENVSFVVHKTFCYHFGCMLTILVPLKDPCIQALSSWLMSSWWSFEISTSFSFFHDGTNFTQRKKNYSIPSKKHSLKRQSLIKTESV